MTLARACTRLLFYQNYGRIASTALVLETSKGFAKSGGTTRECAPGLSERTSPTFDDRSFRIRLFDEPHQFILTIGSSIDASLCTNFRRQLH
ncbi:hypothetical protein ACVWWO_003627 [Bradyrhizobium sp. F1.13.1]